MSKTVIGVFSREDSAKHAVQELRASGFGTNEISIIARDRQSDSGEATMSEDGNLTTGVTTGGILGGIAGLAAGVGALAVPGIGPLVAAGPLTGIISGAATGGIAGGLVDWGIPTDRSDFYEGKVREGRILTTIRTEEHKVDEAASILRHHGATDVESH
ncbi:MAG TPA: general stress protein [bacterium]|jgi:hypothetical protein|nr:general stress protein [bacterium]